MSTKGNVGADEQYRRTKKIENIGSGIVASVLIYLVGMMGYAISEGVVYSEEHTLLKNKQTELTRKIDEWQRFIPLMREPLAIQYKDSLENAIKDTTQINPIIRELEAEKEKKDSRIWYSWAAFFMKD